MTEAAAFSPLEASITNAAVPPRPMSSKADAVFHHAQADDLNVNELDFDYGLCSKKFQAGPARSLHDTFASIQVESHCKNDKNFPPFGTCVDLFSVNDKHQGWQKLDNLSFEEAVNDISDTSRSRPGLSIFLIPLVPTPDTSFGAQTSVSLDSINTIFSKLDLDPVFVLNILGRPDYWAPQTITRRTRDGTLTSLGISLQHPRWNLQVQGSPISVYMCHNIPSGKTTYIVAHKTRDTIISSLRELLDAQMISSPANASSSYFLGDPLNVHCLISSLSMEASKFHVKKFQRFMWAQFTKIDDHFAGTALRERQGLDGLTKELQVISLNADSHVANASTANRNAIALRQIHREIMDRECADDRSVTINSQQQRTIDVLNYIIESMDKQKMWFLNYKSRKEHTAALVFNLVTQQDAANNLSIAGDMKRDSSSMNAIAALTMLFLPGTFTASVLGAGVFSFVASSNNNVHLGHLWWFWVAVTVPLTAGVMLAWYFYQRSRMRLPIGSSTRSQKTRELEGATKSRHLRRTAAAWLRWPKSWNLKQVKFGRSKKTSDEERPVTLSLGPLSTVHVEPKARL